VSGRGARLRESGARVAATTEGHTLWARNEEHAHALIEWLSSGRSGTGTSYETLPKWMITDRAKVVAKLRKLVDGG
jgi:hypothetical protein